MTAVEISMKMTNADVELTGMYNKERGSTHEGQPRYNGEHSQP